MIGIGLTVTYFNAIVVRGKPVRLSEIVAVIHQLSKLFSFVLECGFVVRLGSIRAHLHIAYM